MTTQWLTRNFIAIGVVSTFMYLYYLGDGNFSDFKFSIGVIFVIIWLLSPYIVWAYANEYRPNSFSKYRYMYIGFAMAMPMIGFGMVYYTKLFPDAQNAFFIFEIPLIQFFCLGVAWAVCKK